MYVLVAGEPSIAVQTGLSTIDSSAQRAQLFLGGRAGREQNFAFLSWVPGFSPGLGFGVAPGSPGWTRTAHLRSRRATRW